MIQREREKEREQVTLFVNFLGKRREEGANGESPSGKLVVVIDGAAMEVALRLSFDPSSLARYDREFNPFAMVHSTDVKQGINLDEGMASKRVPFVKEVKGRNGELLLEAEERVLLFPSDLGKTESRDQGESSLHGLVPIRDLQEDICVRIYVQSLHLDDSKDDLATEDVDAEKPYLYTVGPGVRPIIVFMGQANIPAHVMMRFLIADGEATLAGKKKKEEEDEVGGEREFPVTRLKQEVLSVATKEGVEARIDTLRQGNAAERALAAVLEGMGSDKLMKKGVVHVHASLRATTAQTRAMTLRERLDLLADYYTSKAPVDREERKHHKSVHMETASMAYDKRTAEEDARRQRALESYEQAYNEFFDASGGGATMRFGKRSLAPDAPHMARFRLPFWTNGTDRIPYAEWWARTLLQNAPHLPRPTLQTERFLANILEIGLNHMGVSVNEFMVVADDILYRVQETRQEKRAAYLDRTKLQWALFVRCIEAVFAALMAPAHACRYSSDGRYVNALYRLLRVDVESPQHDTAAGVSDDGDCEDLQKLMIIVWAILLLGRDGGDLSSGGRGWADKLVATARYLLQHYCDFNNFGSVRGAQLADANPNDEEGLIGTPDDLTEDIGGHMYGSAAPLPVVARRYAKNRAFVQDCLDDTFRRRKVDLAELVTRHFEDNVLAQWSKAGSPERAFLQALWAQAPCLVLEMTGRQEPLMMPLEHYFGLSVETLQRLAERASMIEVLQRWPKPREHKHQHRSQTLYQEQVASMGSASPYMFQKRVLVRDSFKVDMNCGRKTARHLTSFGRRIIDTYSLTLSGIDATVFGHMRWVCPSKGTYGPPIRLFLDNDSNDIVPVPLPASVRFAYLLDENGQRSREVEEAFMKMMRRLIPYAPFTFAGESSNAIVASNAASPSTPFSSSRAAFSGRAFFCHDHSKDVLSRARPASLEGSELVVRVPADGAVASAMRCLFGSKRRDWSTTVRSRLVAQSPTGMTSSEQIQSIWQHISAGSGVSNVKIYTERIAPTFSDGAFASFERRVRFIIDEEGGGRASLSSKGKGFCRTGEMMDLNRMHHFMEEHGIDAGVVSARSLLEGRNVEREHGRFYYAPRLREEPNLAYLNVTDDDEETELKIALAHLAENPGLRDAKGKTLIPDYYEALHDMEANTDRLWARSGVERPSIFRKDGQRGSEIRSFAQQAEASLRSFGVHNL